MKITKKLEISAELAMKITTQWIILVMIGYLCSIFEER